MAELDQPKPPPVLDSFADVIDQLDELLRLTTSVHDQLGEGPYGLALDALRAIADACGVDWDDVHAVHQRRVGYTE